MESFIQPELEKMKEHHFVEKVHILKALQQRFGNEVIEIAQKAQADDIRAEWEMFGELHGVNDLEELVHVVWEHYAKSGGFEFTVENKDEGIQIYCTKCPLADMAVAIGEAEWGYKFYCATDPIMVEAFNPNIGFKRTKTIMEGHECCNHFYYYKSPPVKEG